LEIPSSNENKSKTLTNYTTYTNDEFEVTFEYPSNWHIEEKTSRFSNDPDVKVNLGLNSFKFIGNDARIGNNLDLFSLEDIADMAQNTMVNPPDQRLIEGVEMDKYKIDGKDTATFLFTNAMDCGVSSVLNLDYAIQIFFVENNGKVYTLAYQDTVSDFDREESQVTMNRILNSFYFTGGNTNDDIINEDVEEESNFEESDNNEDNDNDNESGSEENEN
jgi:hypothetical protein